jgi:hypothetical protein
MALSETNKKILQLQQVKKATENVALPDFTTGNSSAQVVAEKTPLAKVAFGPVFGGARPKDYAEVAKTVGQGIARGYQATGSQLVETVKNPTTVSLKNAPVIDPNTFFGESDTASKIGRAVFGDKPFSLKSEDEEILSLIGLEGGSATSGGTLTALLTATDLFTGGGGSGLKGLIKSLTAAEDVVEIGKVLRTAGFEEDIVAQYADLFAKTRNVKDTTTTLEAAARLQNSTRKVETTPLRANDGAEIITLGGKVLPDEVSSLRVELTKALDELGGEVVETVRNDLNKGEVPSLIQFDTAVRTLADAGVDTAQFGARVADIRSTVRTEPGRFLDEPVLSGFAGDVPVVGSAALETAVDTGITTARSPVNENFKFQVIDEQDVPTLKPGEVVRRKTYAGTDNTDDVTYEYPEYTVKAKSEKTGGILLKKVDDGEEVWVNKRDYADIREVQRPVKPKLDEVANPVKEDMGRLSADVQTRYGKGKVTKSQAAKFKATEQKVFNEIFRIADEFKFIRDKKGGVGALTQEYPAWVRPELRDPQVFSELTEILSRGDIPSVHGSPHMELYLAMVDETARRLDVKSKGAKPAVSRASAITQARQQAANPKMLAEGPVVPRKETVELSTDLAYEEYAKMMQKEPAKRVTPKYHNNGKTVLPKEVAADDIKDIGSFGAIFTDIYRASESVWKESWPKVKERIFDPFDRAKGNMAREEIALVEKLEAKIVTKLGIQRKSAESAAVMDLGEGVKTYDQIVKQFGEEKALKIDHAAVWFRGEYDRMIDEINMKMPEGFAIPKRTDYFRHFEELSPLKNSFEDPALGNLTDDGLWAKIKRFSFTKERTGEASVRDAVGGFLNYIPQYVYAKHINPEVANINAFVKELGENGLAPTYRDLLEAWAGELAFNLNPIDNGLMRLIPGGRRTLDVTNYFNNRVKRNAVLGNVGTALAQGFNVPNGIATAGPVASFKSAVHTSTQALGIGTRYWEKSDFITERYKNSVYTGFSVGFWEKTTDKAGWMISVFDEVGTKFIWNAQYIKAKADGIADPLKYADDTTRKMVAGRGVGEVPLIQKSKIFQIAAPFTLEATNTLFVMKDMLKGNKYGQMMTFLAATYFMNGVIEKITGQQVSMNPADALKDAYGIMTEEETAETESSTADKATRAAGRVLGEAADGIPLGKYVVQGITGLGGMTEKDRTKFFSEEGDPLRYGSSPLLWNAVSPFVTAINPTSDLGAGERVGSAFSSFLRIGTPLGGRQVEKTVGGIDHMRGEDQNPMVRPGVPGAVQNVLFGRWSPNIQYEGQIKEEVAEMYRDNAETMKSGDTARIEAMKKDLEALPENLKSLYRAAAAEEKAKETQRQIDNMKPTYRSVAILMKLGKDEEAKAILAELTLAEEKIYRETHKYFKSEAYNSRAEIQDNPESIIRESIDFAYAFGTNPVQAFKLWWADETIETTLGGSFDGLVTARRIPKEESEAIKVEMGAKKGQILEHKLPLTLGGNNSRANLEIVDADVHDAWTPVETYLGDAVKQQKLDWVTAQEFILRHKGYEGEPLTFEEIKRVVGVESFNNQSEDVHRGLDDIGRNSWLLSDAAYAKRQDPVVGGLQGRRTLDHIERDKLLEE